MKYVVALAILAFSLTADRQLGERASSAIFKSVDFIMMSDKPGAAIAFRLKKNRPHAFVSICFRLECQKVSETWKLIATDPRIQQKQLLLIEDGEHRYTFRRIALKGANDKIATLRLPSSIIAKIDEEGQLISTNQRDDKRIFGQSIDRPWSTQWALPVQSTVTSEFGSIRVPPHGEPYSHTGADLRAATGTKIKATSDGVVIQAEDHVIEGRVVTIDHGWGLMSRYAHLSQFKVKPGDLVKTGDVIGLSGTTGRSEAPHLHFEMRIRGQPVDPLSTQRLMARLSYLE